MKTAKIHKTDANRFASKVRIDGLTGCHVWKGKLTKRGYGKFWINREGFQAHRYAYEQVYGAIPEGELVYIICGTLGCVNAVHMALHSSREATDFRFDSRVGEISWETGCWAWVNLDGTDVDGYGRLKVGDRTMRASRYQYMRHFGAIPEGLFVCHTCDNPPCINPAHFFLGPRVDNSADMVEKERHAYGERSGSAKLKLSQAQEIKELYATKLYLQRELAEMFDVHQTSIGGIVRGETWSLALSKAEAQEAAA